MPETLNTTASCQCGALTVQLTEPPVIQLVCHCQDCQNMTGKHYTEGAFYHPTAYTANGDANTETMQGATGFDKTNYSCAKCDTPVYATISALNGACAVMANTLSPFTFEPQVHLWTSSKADTVTIPAGIPQSAEGPQDELRDYMIGEFWKRDTN